MYSHIPFGINCDILISYMLYADDCILFCEAALSQWDNTTLLLHYAHTWTCLTTNNSKSSIFFSSNVHVPLIQNILNLSKLTLMPGDALYLRNPLPPLRGVLVTITTL